jgi:predicted NBD/HSP70 family sugar kinase
LMAAQKSVGGGSITHQPITQHEHTWSPCLKHTILDEKPQCGSCGRACISWRDGSGGAIVIAIVALVHGGRCGAAVLKTIGR